MRMVKVRGEKSKTSWKKEKQQKHTKVRFHLANPLSSKTRDKLYNI